MAAIFFDNGSHIIGNIPTITPHAYFGMIFSSLTSRLTTPPQMEISISECDSHYLSISM
jgi:hypothetical protein